MDGDTPLLWAIREQAGLEWQTMGSLHRRLRACSLGVRAEVLDYGAPKYLALELYLAWRGEGLPMESSAVRR